MMKADKSFSSGVRQPKWNLERKMERMDACRKMKYLGLLTLPTGKKSQRDSEINIRCL